MAPASAVCMVGLFEPLRAAPDDRALAGGLLAPQSSSGGRHAPASGRVHRFSSCARTARRRARFARTAPRRTSRWPRAALLCVQCAADYAERADTLGCARCGEALRIGFPIEGHDVEGLCAPCVVSVAAAAAAKAAAAPLLARIEEIEAGAARPNTVGRTMGRDRRYPAFDCCGATLGEGYDQYTVYAKGGGTSTRPVAPAALRLLRADAVTFKVLVADAAGSPPSIRDY